MSQSTILAAGMTAADSSTVVVTSTPVVVSVFSSAGGRIPSGVQMPLERLSPGAVWQPVFDEYRGNYGPVILGDLRMDVMILGPGSYRVRRQAITTQVGVALDTTA